MKSWGERSWYSLVNANYTCYYDENKSWNGDGDENISIMIDLYTIEWIAY